MKKILYGLCISISLLVFAGILIEAYYQVRSNMPGIVRDVRIDIGVSDMFTQDEIKYAMDVVKETFASQRDSWNRLLELRYEENLSIREAERRGRDENSTMVIFAGYYRGQGFGNEAARAGWFWILVRDSPYDPWKVHGGGKIL